MRVRLPVVEYPAALAAPAQAKLTAPRPAATINPPRLLVSNSSATSTATAVPGDSVTAIDTNTNQVITTLALRAGDSPIDVIVTPDNTRAYTANIGCNNCQDRGMTVLDPAGPTVTGQLSPGLFPGVLALSPDGSRLYVGDFNILRTFDVVTGSQLTTRDLAVSIQSMAVSPDGQSLYVVASSSQAFVDVIWVVPTANQPAAVFYQFQGGSSCSAVILIPGASKLFVGCNAGVLYAININADGTLAATAQYASTRLFAMAASPDGRKLYVPRVDTASVDVLDTATGSRLATIAVQSGPVNMIVNKSGARGYVANFTSATVSVLDLTNDTVITHVPVGPGPFGLALTAAGVSPFVPSGGAVNGASFAPAAAVAPGSLISIFGTGLGPDAAAGATSLPLPTTLGGAKVTIGTFSAPLIYVSVGQINCQVPFELTGQSSAPVVVQTDSGISSAITLPLTPAAPGLFTATVSGRSQGAVLNQDSSLNTPTNPARAGEVIQIFATGQGSVGNAPASGAAAPGGPNLAATPTNPVVLIGGVQAPVSFSGLAPGFVGLWQINAAVPAGIAAGDSVTLQLVYGTAIANSTILSVR